MKQKVLCCYKFAFLYLNLKGAELDASLAECLLRRICGPTEHGSSVCTKFYNRHVRTFLDVVDYGGTAIQLATARVRLLLSEEVSAAHIIKGI